MTQNKTADASRTLVAALAQASHEEDIDSACRLVQDILGVTDGGVAGLYFGDPEMNWKVLSVENRRDHLIAYVSMEILHLDIPGQGHAHSAGERARGQASHEEEHDTAQYGQEQTFRDFQSTRRKMSAPEFGDMIGDRMWENELDTVFLVYNDRWWIEICDDGRYMLVLENRSWITGPDTTLEDLERELFDFSLHDQP